MCPPCCRLLHSFCCPIDDLPRSTHDFLLTEEDYSWAMSFIHWNMFIPLKLWTIPWSLLFPTKAMLSCLLLREIWYCTMYPYAVSLHEYFQVVQTRCSVYVWVAYMDSIDNLPVTSCLTRSISWDWYVWVMLSVWLTFREVCLYILHICQYYVALAQAWAKFPTGEDSCISKLTGVMNLVCIHT